MKLKIIASLLLLLLTTSFAYASFPVKKQKEAVTTVQSMDNDTSADYVLASSAQGANNKSQLAALLLCLFIGIFGVHRFYLGYIWQGVVQLLTLGVFGIWTLIDLILIATGDLQPKSGPYGRPFGS